MWQACHNRAGLVKNEVSVMEVNFSEFRGFASKSVFLFQTCIIINCANIQMMQI